MTFVPCLLYQPFCSINPVLFFSQMLINLIKNGILSILSFCYTGLHSLHRLLRNKSPLLNSLIAIELFLLPSQRNLQECQLNITHLLLSVISQSHISTLDQIKYSKFSYCCTGLGAGCSTKEAIDSFFCRAL